MRNIGENEITNMGGDFNYINCECITDIKGIKLPIEYQQVEYLESTTVAYNSNYINTGIFPDNNTCLEIEFNYTTNQTDYTRVYGATDKFRTETSSNAPILSFYYGTAGTTRRYTTENLGLTRHIVKQCKNLVYVDNELRFTFAEEVFTDTNQLRLFSAASGDRDSVIRVYDCKIWKNDDLVRHFIPCYRKADNEAGMYDSINNIFYANNGNVPFLIGGNV